MYGWDSKIKRDSWARNKPFVYSASSTGRHSTCRAMTQHGCVDSRVLAKNLRSQQRHANHMSALAGDSWRKKVDIAVDDVAFALLSAKTIFNTNYEVASDILILVQVVG